MYKVNEIFYSIQGEGRRAGEASIFVRMAHCNLACSFCDTEFESAVDMSAKDIVARCNEFAPRSWVILTGGEPAMQVDDALLDAFSENGNMVAMETNGMFRVNKRKIDWLVVSPKTAEHTLKVTHADELRYVRHGGQGIPLPKVDATHLYLSPMWGPDGRVDPEALATCIELVKQHPWWRLSIQAHKLWEVR